MAVAVVVDDNVWDFFYCCKFHIVLFVCALYHSMCHLECTGEKLMPKTETSTKWLRGTSSDIDIDELIAGAEVTYSDSKLKPRFKLFPEGDVAMVVTELSLIVSDAVKEVIVLPNGQEPSVSLIPGRIRFQGRHVYQNHFASLSERVYSKTK